MQITRVVPTSNKAPAEWFTGDAWIDAIAVPVGASRCGANAVHFAPGARTAWHTHPHGQTIFITEGIGRCQSRGGELVILNPGDRVYFEPGEDHWHGASPERFMTHIAVQQADEDGRTVTWGVHVSDAEYAPDGGG
jgi:quercetin dioxygenase-like cupin family protein